MSETVQYPQYSAEGLPLTYVPNPFSADGKPVDSQWKVPVRVHTVGPVTLYGLQIVDTVGVMEGDRVLVKDQVNPAENGIYVVSAGPWRRAPDMYLWAQFVGAVVATEEGITVQDTVWLCQVPATGTVDVTPVYWVPVSTSAGTLGQFAPLRAIVSDPLGNPTASPTTSQEIAYVSGVTSSIQQQFAAVNDEAGAAFAIAVAGTNAAASAQSTANSAYYTAQSGSHTANDAYVIACIGTNVAMTGTSIANSAWSLAQIGTNVGSNAYNYAVALGDKYVRTTRFASIGTTAGTVALPPNSSVVLDDFGGTTDAIVTALSGGFPSYNHVFTAGGAVVTTTFDSSGAYALSGDPVGYPVALVYRVRQKLSQFDSTGTDIIGGYDTEQIDYIQGTPDQVYVNGSITPQFGPILLSLPQSIAAASTPTFAGLTSTGSVYTKFIDFDTINSDTVARATGRLWWDNAAKTLGLGMAGTAVVQQIGEEFLIRGYNNTAGIIGDGQVVYIAGANGTYPNFALASATSRPQSRAVVGIATEDILPGAFGYVTSQGVVNDINTAALTLGRPVYLDTTAGGLTLTPPVPPYSTVFIGIVVRQNGSNGAIYVDLRPSGALSELQDVSIPAPVAGQQLTYNGSVWTAAFSSGEVSHNVFSYYLDGTYPEFPGYEKLSTVPAGGTEVIETVSVTSAGSVLIDQYISGTFGRSQLDAGAWSYETYAAASSKSNYLQVKTYVLSGTTETALWQFTTSEVPTAVGPVPQSIFGTVTPVNLTDRLLVRYYAVRIGGGSANVSLYHNGNTHYTHIDTPFPAFHNSLAGLQGGDGADQFFHLSGTQYSQFEPTVITANAAYALAQIGTNTGTAAYNLAATGSNVAWAAYVIAQAGTAPLALSNLTDVVLNSPTAQQVLTFTGSVWTNDDVPVVISPSAFNLFLDDTASGTAGYNSLKTVNTGTEVLDSVSLTSNNPTPIESFLSPMVDVTVLPAGIWGFESYVSASSGGRSLVVTADVYKRSISGVETYLFSGTTDVFSPTTTPSRYVATSSTGSFAVALTDKLVAKYWFIKSSGGNTTAILYHNGSNHASLIQTTLGLVHNQLAGLQGGGANEYFHVTLDQNAAMSGVAFSPSAANPFVTSSDLAVATAFAVNNVASGTTTITGAKTNRVYLVDTTAASAVVVYPNAIGWTGATVHVKKVSVDANTIQLRSVTGTQTFDGQLYPTISGPYTSLQTTSNGTNWFII